MCLLALGLVLPLGDRLAGARGNPRSRRGARGAVRRVGVALGWAAVCTGSMVLSVYAGHIVVMGLAHRLLGHSFASAQPLWVLITFTASLGVAATVWERWRGRGPLESAASSLELFGDRCHEDIDIAGCVRGSGRGDRAFRDVDDDVASGE